MIPFGSDTVEGMVEAAMRSRDYAADEVEDARRMLATAEERLQQADDRVTYWRHVQAPALTPGG